MNDNERKIEKELNNIYRYVINSYGNPPQNNHPLFKKYNQVRGLVNDLIKTNFNAASVIENRYLKGKSWERIQIEMSYSRSRIFELRIEGIKKLTQLAIDQKREREE